MCDNPDNKETWERNNELPNDFTFQVYLLHGASEVVSDTTLERRLGKLLDTDRFPQFEHCLFDIYPISQPSIVACIEHHKQEILSQISDGHGPITDLNDLNFRHRRFFNGFLIVIDSVNWEQEGVVFTKIEPQPSEEEYHSSSWKNYVYENSAEMVAFKVRNVSQTSVALHWICAELGGLVKTMDDPNGALEWFWCDYKGRGATWGEALHIPYLLLPDLTDKQRVYEPKSELRSPDLECIKYTCGTASYADYEGQSVTSIWNTELEDNPPTYCYHAYVRPTETSEYMSPSATFKALNIGPLKSVAWRLDLHEHPGSLAKCMRNYVQNQRRLREYGRALGSYQGGKRQPFNDVFIVKNLGRHELVRNHPIAYETYADFEKMESEVRLRVSNFKSLQSLSDELCRIWALCKDKKYVFHYGKMKDELLTNLQVM